MGSKNQQHEENEIIRNIASFPTFLNGATFDRSRKDPPDFLGKCVNGQIIGLELTSWLDSKQTKAAQGRVYMSDDLLRIIDWERHPRPVNISSAVIFPKWGKRVREAHRQRFKDEFHAAVQNFDGVLKRLRGKHWRSLSPEECFSYEAHQNELKSYPTLCRYVSSICFFERTEPTAASNERWVRISSCDENYGVYDPTWSVQALKKAIESKVSRYSNRDAKAHLDAQNLPKFYLLVYAHSELFTSNTPYQNGAQMAVSPLEGLAEAAKAATENLSSSPKVFDGVFLFYPAWNSQWLAQIWPAFESVPFLDR
jgi:hypothetical protein